MLLASRARRGVRDIMKMSSSTRQFEEVSHSQIYAKYRPVPPPSLMEQIIAFSGEQKGEKEAKEKKEERRERVALDVGCGSGQFTRLLTAHFSRVLATDVSRAQVDQVVNTK